MASGPLGTRVKLRVVVFFVSENSFLCFSVGFLREASIERRDEDGCIDCVFGVAAENSYITVINEPPKQ